MLMGEELNKHNERTMDVHIRLDSMKTLEPSEQQHRHIEAPSFALTIQINLFCNFNLIKFKMK